MGWHRAFEKAGRPMRRRDEKHLAWLRTLPCCICGDPTSTEAAHIRMADARIGKPITGNSIKPDDRYVLPLCGLHHRMQHAVGERKFWQASHEIPDPILTALALYSISGDVNEAMKVINARL